MNLSSDVIIFGLSLAFTLFMTGLGAYVKIISRLRELEVRVAHNEATDKAILRKLDQQNEKLDNLTEVMTEIRIELSNKQNRQ